MVTFVDAFVLLSALQPAKLRDNHRGKAHELVSSIYLGNLSEILNLNVFRPFWGPDSLTIHYLFGFFSPNRRVFWFLISMRNLVRLAKVHGLTHQIVDASKVNSMVVSGSPKRWDR